MCGRYVLLDINSLEEGLLRDKKAPGHKLKPNYNVAPTQTMPVITESNGKKHVELMRWGIPRTLGKDMRKELFNTRSDKALQWFWKKTVQTHRCLIPANGFYEWKCENDGKQPYFIRPKQLSLFSFAGIYEEYTTEDETIHKTYSIMTTEPNKEMSDIHTRMPVILHPGDEDDWLEAKTDEQICKLLMPLEDNSLSIVPVSQDVNSARNNAPYLVEAIS